MISLPFKWLLWRWPQSAERAIKQQQDELNVQLKVIKSVAIYRDRNSQYLFRFRVEPEPQRKCKMCIVTSIQPVGNQLHWVTVRDMLQMSFWLGLITVCWICLHLWIGCKLLSNLCQSFWLSDSDCLETGWLSPCNLCNCLVIESWLPQPPAVTRHLQTFPSCKQVAVPFLKTSFWRVTLEFCFSKKSTSRLMM